MLVEALFWFYPPVWLIGERLIAERERACDESVPANGHDAEVYARGILKVCRFCVRSPLACVSGASSADLAGRVRQIMSDETLSGVHGAQKALLATALAVALGIPVVEGFAAPPLLIVAEQRRVAAVKPQFATTIVQAAAEARQIAAAPAVPIKVRRSRRLKIVAISKPPAEPSLPAQAPADADPPPQLPQPPADASPATAMPLPAPLPQPMPAAAASVAPQQLMTVKDVFIALYPQGNGDPDQVTCPSPEALAGSRLPGPRVCQTNRQWASLRARHEDITPDGQGIIVPDGSEQRVGIAMLTCSLGRVTGSGISKVLGVPATVCF